MKKLIPSTNNVNLWVKGGRCYQDLGVWGKLTEPWDVLEAEGDSSAHVQRDVLIMSGWECTRRMHK